jgi:hypothetical protein
MKNIVKVALATTLLLSLGATTASADAAKGQKLYKKKLSHACGMNGAKMAAEHTQDEWAADKGSLAKEIKRICPAVKDKALKSKYLPHYYDFFYNFASDSGNVPSC